MSNLFYVANGDGQKLSPAVPLPLAEPMLERFQTNNPGVFYKLTQYFADVPTYKTPDELYAGEQ